MIGKPKNRSKSNLQSSTPQSKKNTSNISVKFNCWLTRFNLQPKLDSETERNPQAARPVERTVETSQSPIILERPRPHSKPASKNVTSPIRAYPSKTVNRTPSQTITNFKAKIRGSAKPESLSEYTIGNTIGTGAYSVVKLGIHKENNKKVALKIYDKSKLAAPSQQKTVENEVKILSILDHPNIVKLHQNIDSPKHLYIILEYISGYSLSSCLKRKPNRRLEEFEVNKYFKEILQALAYCHSRGITHRDIKLENVLVDNSQKRVKLIDFGFATCFSNMKKVKMFCGTPSYMAPEIVSRKEYAGPPVDVWAAGVLLYVLLTGHFPFKGSSDKELYKAILKGHLVFPDYLSLKAKQLILKILVSDPQSRPQASDLLEDPWFKSSSKILRLERLSEDCAKDLKKSELFYNSLSSLDLLICRSDDIIS